LFLAHALFLVLVCSVVTIPKSEEKEKKVRKLQGGKKWTKKVGKTTNGMNIFVVNHYNLSSLESRIPSREARETPPRRLRAQR